MGVSGYAFEGSYASHKGSFKEKVFNIVVLRYKYVYFCIFIFKLKATMEYRFRFENFEVWKISKQLAVNVYELLKSFPSEEKFGLVDQLRRACISVPSNIAEGTSRMSVKEQVHFISMAYGSLMEMYCQFQIAEELNYGDKTQIENLLKEIKRTSYLLNKYRQSLTNTSA